MSSDKQTKEITINRMSRVGWFDTRQLFYTGVKVIASTLIGSMTGRRELVAALDPDPDMPTADYSADRSEALFVDYVADTGDGWDATLSVAWLVGRDGLWLKENLSATEQQIPKDQAELSLDDPSPEMCALRAGRLLILGGDQVYPFASAQSYKERFEDPFQSARRYETEGRDLFAIPGNHDWYDGLTAFLRLFCQPGRWIGCWQAKQARSYFTIKLPNNWWIWAADAALEDDLDSSQQKYFERASELLKDDPHAKVVLFVPNPTWALSPEEKKSDIGARKQATIYEKIYNLAARADGQNCVAAVISGDLHHYARHETVGDERPVHYITCGGGGAYTLGTRAQPVKFVDPQGRDAVLKGAFPSTEASDRMRWGALKFAIASRGFSALFASILVLGVWFLNMSSTWLAGVSATNPDIPRITPLLRSLSETAIGAGGAESVAWNVVYSLIYSPLVTIYCLVVIGGLVAFAYSGRNPKSHWAAWLVAGLSHAAVQLLVAFLLTWTTALFFRSVGFYPDGVSSASLLGMVFILFFSGALMILVNGTLFGFYLMVSNMSVGMHEQEVFSCQASTAYKSFLRLKFTAEGLEIFPIGLMTSNEKWREAPEVTVTQRTPNHVTGSVAETLSFPEHAQRLYDPKSPLAPQLIENPIRIPPRP